MGFWTKVSTRPKKDKKGKTVTSRKLANGLTVTSCKLIWPREVRIELHIKKATVISVRYSERRSGTVCLERSGSQFWSWVVDLFFVRYHNGSSVSQTTLQTRNDSSCSWRLRLMVEYFYCFLPRALIRRKRVKTLQSEWRMFPHSATRGCLHCWLIYYVWSVFKLEQSFFSSVLFSLIIYETKQVEPERGAVNITGPSRPKSLCLIRQYTPASSWLLFRLANQVARMTHGVGVYILERTHVYKLILLNT